MDFIRLELDGEYLDILDIPIDEVDNVIDAIFGMSAELRKGDE